MTNAPLTPPSSSHVLALIFAMTSVSCGDGGGGSGHIHVGDGSVTVGEPPGLEGITDLHNQARSMVSPAASPAIPPLTWSNSVAADAQTWANGCQFMHSGNGHGENIFASAGSTISASGVVSSWVSEAPNYNYGANSCSGVCGHYTQVVWRNTTSVGCGIKHCTSNSPFGSSFPTWDLVVCDYDPPGNFNGTRPY